MQTLHWRVSMDTARIYEDLVARISWLHPDNDQEEFTVLREEIQRLPDFPRVDDWQNTAIVPVVDTERKTFFWS